MRRREVRQAVAGYRCARDAVVGCARRGSAEGNPHRHPEGRLLSCGHGSGTRWKTCSQPLGIEVKWIDFQFGPPLLEAINVGSVDFGYVGDAPPIFAQAAGAQDPLRRRRQAERQHAGDHRAAGFADQDARRSQGQAHRLRQGIERAQSSGRRAREGRPRLERHHAGAARAGRCDRGLRRKARSMPGRSGTLIWRWPS